MAEVDLNQCYKVAMEAISGAAKIVLEGYEGAKKISSKSSAFDIVTEYDMKVEAHLINSLKETFPEHKFLAEETMSNEKMTDTPTWVIDPIDGTTNFVSGFPYCAIAVGLAVKREVVLGIVSSPPLDQTFTAIKGKGAFLNGTRIQVSNTNELQNAVVVQEISLGSIPQFTDFFVKRYRACVTKVRGMRAFGSAQMSLCLLAMGSVDGIQVEHLGPWDVAAGSVIVTEAGGTILDVHGGTFDCEKGRIIAASTSRLAKQLVEIWKLE